MQHTQLDPPSFCDRQTKSEWKAAAKEMKTRKWQKLKSFVICESMRRGGREGREAEVTPAGKQSSSSAADEEEQRETEAESARHFTLFVVAAVQMEVGGREVEPIWGAKWNLCRSMGDFVYCPFAAC